MSRVWLVRAVTGRSVGNGQGEIWNWFVGEGVDAESCAMSAL